MPSSNGAFGDEGVRPSILESPVLRSMCKVSAPLTTRTRRTAALQPAGLVAEVHVSAAAQTHVVLLRLLAPGEVLQL